jgi:hypothetical protein
LALGFVRPFCVKTTPKPQRKIIGFVLKWHVTCLLVAGVVDLGVGRVGRVGRVGQVHSSFIIHSWYYGTLAFPSQNNKQKVFLQVEKNVI